jgi:hypothetical protein
MEGGRGHGVDTVRLTKMGADWMADMWEVGEGEEVDD